MKASGSILVLAEMIAELPWGSDDLPIFVTHPGGEFSVVTEATFETTQLSLHIDSEPDVSTYRELLEKAMDLLNEIVEPKSKATKKIRDLASLLADEIEENL